MDVRRQGEVEISIEAGPQTVYELISDVTRTGEWSPECRRCEWVGGVEGPSLGARFRGWNRSGLVRWSRQVEVIEATPPAAFAFRTLPDGFNKDSTTWRYDLVPGDGVTRLVHSYEITALPRFPVSWIMRLFLRHHADMRPQMEESLERIKKLAETSAPAEKPVA
jgi:Polyketide cyclase / dehydrase and lipid transport